MPPGCNQYYSFLQIEQPYQIRLLKALRNTKTNSRKTYSNLQVFYVALATRTRSLEYFCPFLSFHQNPVKKSQHQTFYVLGYYVLGFYLSDWQNPLKIFRHLSFRF